MGAAADRIARKLDTLIERACKMLALEIDKELRRATPRDTGHARANWIPSVGQPNRTEAEGISSAAHDAGIAEVISFKLGQGTLYVSNVVPYIRALNYGHSKQAPALFVEASMDRAMATVQRKLSVDLQRSAFQSQVGAAGAEGLASSYSPFGE